MPRVHVVVSQRGAHGIGSIPRDAFNADPDDKDDANPFGCKPAIKLLPQLLRFDWRGLVEETAHRDIGGE